MNSKEQKLQAFSRLLDIMDELREKCPWDRKQTLESIRHLTIEETYELSDAILDADYEEVRKELGDLILHIVFYSKIASETEQFDIADVIEGICEKLIRRHPHIYGDQTVEDGDDVKKNWEQIKLSEGKKSVLQGVPNTLPALLKAYRVQEKVRGVGFEWPHKDQPWDKLKEELEEFQHEINQADIDPQKAEMEFGDVLFSLISYAQYNGINPEDALERTNKKFIKRFQFLEQEAKDSGKSLSDMTLSEMAAIWEKSKHHD